MRTIQVHLPDSLDLDETEAKMWLASRLYEKGKLSMGQAAEMVGLSKRTFMELLGRYGVNLFEMTEDDLDDDIKNAEDYSSNLWT